MPRRQFPQPRFIQRCFGRQRPEVKGPGPFYAFFPPAHAARDAAIPGGVAQTDEGRTGTDHGGAPVCVLGADSRMRRVLCQLSGCPLVSSSLVSSELSIPCKGVCKGV